MLRYSAPPSCLKERWPSGRRRTPGTRVGGQPSRGFESLPLRQSMLKINILVAFMKLPHRPPHHIPNARQGPPRPPPPAAAIAARLGTPKHRNYLLFQTGRHGGFTRVRGLLLRTELVNVKVRQ